MYIYIYTPKIANSNKCSGFLSLFFWCFPGSAERGSRAGPGSSAPGPPPRQGLPVAGAAGLRGRGFGAEGAEAELPALHGGEHGASEWEWAGKGGRWVVGGGGWWVGEGGGGWWVGEGGGGVGVVVVGRGGWWGCWGWGVGWWGWVVVVVGLVVGGGG